MKKLAMLSLVALFASNAGYAASTSGNAQVNLLTPLAVTETTSLDYGDIIQNAAGDTVSITADATGTISGCTNVTCSATGQSGVFTVSGTASTAVNVNVTGQTAVLDDGGGNTMSFDPFLVTAGKVDTLSPSIGAGGSLTVYVGGDLSIAGTEPAGLYTTANGSPFTITVNY